VDGTVRGDVLPMVKLARPLMPNLLQKVTLQEPWNLYKFLHFCWNLGKLWTLRTVHREHRRRYKHLFSELHHLAASLLEDTPVADVRAKYRECLPPMRGIWFEDAITLLRRLTQQANVILITGSEQAQTEECVRLLGAHGVNTSRIFVHGSLYGCDPATQRFDGHVDHLNVTLDGKRDVVRRFSEDASLSIAGAMGNSRPDRALFEAVGPGGLRALVCSRSVLARRDAKTFTIRKLQRSGFQVAWDVDEYTRAISLEQNSRVRPDTVSILATDCRYQNILDSVRLRREWDRLLKACRNRPVQDTHPSNVLQKAI
jgi:phosphoserine phosphatase